MPAPLAKGLIVLAVVVVAAGAAAYENPQIREWLENSRRKIALVLHSLGDEINPQPRQQSRQQPRRSDSSMREDGSDAAEERRRRARAEIMERGRVMAEKRKRGKSGDKPPSPTGSFDTLVDKDGALRQFVKVEDDSHAISTAVDQETPPNRLKKRQPSPPPSASARGLHESVDASIPLRHLTSTSPHRSPSERFPSSYEHEMRHTWNLPLPHPAPPLSSAHESESLIDLTPTSEFPDVEAASLHSSTRLDQTDYFSVASNSSHTLSEALSPPPPPPPPPPPSHPILHASEPTNGPFSSLQSSISQHAPPASSAPSVASSIDHVGGSDVEGSVSDDGVLSDFDGVRTPASAWTDVGSVMSSEAGQ